VPDDAAALDCAGDCAPVGLEVQRPRPERIEVTTDVDRPTIVSVSQQALPGWTVSIDGEDADIVEVDGIFLGALVPAGEHDVVFTYHSPWLTTTVVLALIALVATIALAGGDSLSARTRTQAAGGGDR
jgi:hypothetical protein